MPLRMERSHISEDVCASGMTDIILGEYLSRPSLVAMTIACVPSRNDARGGSVITTEKRDIRA